MALKNEIVIRPTEISFLKNTCQSFDPVEVLIANRSDKILRFKVFSTSRSKYSLSKCKGVLRSGESVRITFQVIRSQWNNENRRDFFKLQFFDHTNDELLGDRYICATIWADPADSSYQALDSDSCSSWPSREQDKLKLSSSSRTASLNRGFDSLPVTDRIHSKLGSSNLRSMLCTPSLEPVNALSRSHSIPSQFSRNKNKLAIKASENSAQLALAAPGTSTTPCSRSTIWHRIIALIRGFVFGTLLVICVAGISLPLWAAYARELFPRLRFWSAPRAFESGLSCVFDTSDRFYSSPHPSSSAHCPLFQSHPSDSGNANVDEDEFARQSKIAIHSFRTAFLSIYGALIAVDPLTLLPNLSWFCLGKSTVKYILLPVVGVFLSLYCLDLWNYSTIPLFEPPGLISLVGCVRMVCRSPAIKSGLLIMFRWTRTGD